MCNSFWKKAQNIFANDIQHFYNFANRLASPKQRDHDMMSFMSEAPYALEDLKMFLEVESLDEIKKKLDKFYMVMILRAIHLDFERVRYQLLTCHEV